VCEIMKIVLIFFRYLRWSSHNTFIRRSKRVKQLVFRMNQMIENKIKEYPGDNATLAEFFHSIRCMFKQRNFRVNLSFRFIVACEVYTPGLVVYVREVNSSIEIFH